jgi:hypothetical protein
MIPGLQTLICFQVTALYWRWISGDFLVLVIWVARVGEAGNWSCRFHQCWRESSFYESGGGWALTWGNASVRFRWIEKRSVGGDLDQTGEGLKEPWARWGGGWSVSLRNKASTAVPVATASPSPQPALRNVRMLPISHVLVNIPFAVFLLWHHSCKWISESRIFCAQIFCVGPGM